MNKYVLSANDAMHLCDIIRSTPCHNIDTLFSVLQAEFKMILVTGPEEEVKSLENIGSKDCDIVVVKVDPCGDKCSKYLIDCLGVLKGVIEDIPKYQCRHKDTVLFAPIVQDFCCKGGVS